MNINGLGVNNIGNSTSSDQKETNNGLGKDAFMKILIAELQNQDPLKPMDDKDFISQMAQFSALEQLQNLSSNFAQLQAMTMVGKKVYAEVDIEGAAEIMPVEGKVYSVTFIDGKIKMKVDDYIVNLEDVISIYDDNQDVASSSNDSVDE